MNTYKKQRNKIVSAILLVIVFSSALTGPLGAEGGASTSDFVPPERIKLGPPIYPTSQRGSRNAGMVEMLFMIGVDGATFEPIVTRSTKPQFEKAALDAVNDYRFSPALFNGELADSSHDIRVMFMMQESKDSVSPRFASRYKAIRKKLDGNSPDEKEVLKKILSLEKTKQLSPYAYGYLNLVKFQYYSRFGTPKQQIDAIESTLLFEGRTGINGKFLDEDLRRSMRDKLFVLNVQAQRYGDAMRAYRQLVKIDPNAKQKYGNTIDEIQAIRDGDNPTVIDMDIHPRGYTSLDLFKRVFYFSDINGELTGIKLRCRNKFAELPLQLESEYKIPNSWGYCNLQVIGTAETTFKLVQI